MTRYSLWNWPVMVPGSQEGAPPTAIVAEGSSGGMSQDHTWPGPVVVCRLLPPPRGVGGRFSAATGVLPGGAQNTVEGRFAGQVGALVGEQGHNL